MTIQTYWRIRYLKKGESSYEYEAFDNIAEVTVRYLQLIKTCEWVVIHEIDMGLVDDKLPATVEVKDIRTLDSFSTTGVVPPEGSSTSVSTPPLPLQEQTPGVCPYCGGKNLDYGEMEVENEMSYNWSCPDCGAEGTEWYRLSFDGHTTRDGDLIPKGGK